MTESRIVDDYNRRRIDDITDNRLEHLEDRLGRLEARINYLFGILAVLVVLANFLAPFVVAAVKTATVAP